MCYASYAAIITWLSLSRIPHNKSYQCWKHQAGRRETLLQELGRIPSDVHSKLMSSTTKTKSFPDTWALPNVKDATFTVNRWCTNISCYSRNARTIGCGHRRHYQSPLSGSWMFKHWGITYSFDAAREFVSSVPLFHLTVTKDHDICIKIFLW